MLSCAVSLLSGRGSWRRGCSTFDTIARPDYARHAHKLRFMILPGQPPLIRSPTPDTSILRFDLYRCPPVRKRMHVHTYVSVLGRRRRRNRGNVDKIAIVCGKGGCFRGE